MKLKILLAGLLCGLVALAAESGRELFQNAVTLEKANGNLEEAIKVYQRVAREFSSDGALAAKALMQEAHCYELLGQGDPAVKIYEQVARDFGDQRQPAETALAKLASLRFEVASVKRVVLKPNEGYALPRTIGGPGTSGPTRITFLNYSLNWLLQTAYDVKDYQLSEPNWLSSAGSIFVIDATVRPGTTKDQVRWMLQNLLADRFKLTLHRETRDLPLQRIGAGQTRAQAQGIFKGRGPRTGASPCLSLKWEGWGRCMGSWRKKDGFLRLPPGMPLPAMGGPSATWVTPSVMHAVGGNQPIAGMAVFLSRQSGHSVVDKTGLTGNWDYNLEFASGAGPANSPGSPSDPAPAPDLMTAVRDQLGVKDGTEEGPGRDPGRRPYREGPDGELVTGQLKRGTDMKPTSLRWLAWAVAFSWAGLAQSSAATGPSFEVASIKPAPAPTRIASGELRQRIDDGVVDLPNISLMNLISIAYKTNQDYITGPGWLENQNFSRHGQAATAGSSKQSGPGNAATDAGRALQTGGPSQREAPAGVPADSGQAGAEVEGIGRHGDRRKEQRGKAGRLSCPLDHDGGTRPKPDHARQNGGDDAVGGSGAGRFAARYPFARAGSDRIGAESTTSTWCGIRPWRAEAAAEGLRLRIPRPRPPRTSSRLWRRWASSWSKSGTPSTCWWSTM